MCGELWSSEKENSDRPRARRGKSKHLDGASLLQPLLLILPRFERPSQDCVSFNPRHMFYLVATSLGLPAAAKVFYDGLMMLQPSEPKLANLRSAMEKASGEDANVLHARPSFRSSK